MLDWLASLGTSHEALLTLIFGLNAVFLTFVILLENREPARTLAWIFVLFTFPIVGFIIYLFFGHDWHGSRSRQNLRASYETTAHRRGEAATQSLGATILESDLRRLATTTTGFAPTQENRVSILTDAHTIYPRLIAALMQAKTSIDLEYYIFRYDEIGRQIISILKERAAAGIRVRFMVDGYGSIGFGRKAFRDMRAAGIHATYFAPLITPFAFFKANYRDHRKIVIIDGRAAFTGGLNIGDEYLGKSAAGPWRDTSLEIEGPAVQQLATLFEEAWKRSVFLPQASTPTLPVPVSGHECVNVVPSGPTSDWYAIREVFLSMIHGARRSLYIESPYFIPDAGILYALVNAALRGIDVKIIVPKNPDSRLLDWVAMTYLNDIIRAGGRAYAYPIGFLHQKIMIADNEVASIGTCNIDMRSLLLDFEVNILLSHPPTIAHLLEDFFADLHLSEEITFNQLMNRPLRRRIKDSIARLIAPLL